MRLDVTGTSKYVLVVDGEGKYFVEPEGVSEVSLVHSSLYASGSEDPVAESGNP